MFTIINIFQNNCLIIQLIYIIKGFIFWTLLVFMFPVFMIPS